MTAAGMISGDETEGVGLLSLLVKETTTRVEPCTGPSRMINRQQHTEQNGNRQQQSTTQTDSGRNN